MMTQNSTRWAFCLVLVVAGAARGSLVSDFDDGTLQGWQNLDPLGFSATNPGVGGNPGGYLRFTDIFAGGVAPSLVKAPAKFSGDLSGFTSFEFDGFSAAGVMQGNAVDIESSDGTIWAYRPDVIGTEAWHHYSVPINDGTGWFIPGISNGTTPFDQVLKDVTAVYVSMAGQSGLGFESAIDNFMLVPEPSCALLLAFSALATLRRRRN